MSNDVEVEFDPDPNGNHHQMLTLFFEYVNAFERFHKYPSHKTRRLCRERLLAIRKMCNLLRIDIADVHKEVRKLRLDVYEENKRQREIKKALKGK